MLYCERERGREGEKERGRERERGGKEMVIYYIPIAT
jgi:hypothetical protein